MSRLVILNSLWYTAGTVLRQGIALLLLPLYTRALTPSEFGALVVLQSYTLLLAVLGSLQLPNALLRDIPECAADLSRERVVVSTVGAGVIVAALMSGTAMFAILTHFDGLVPQVPEGAGGALALAALSGVLQLLVMVPQLYLVARQRARRSASIGIAAAAGTAAWTLTEFAIQGGSITGALRGEVFGGIVALAIALLTTRSVYAPVLDAAVLRRSARYSLPLMPHALGGYLFSYSDRLILQRFVPAASIAVYGAADRVGMAVKVAVNNFITAFSPHYTGTVVRDPAAANAMTARVVPVVMLMLGVIVFGLTCTASVLVSLIAGPGYAAAGPLVPVFAVAYYFRQLYSFTTLGLFVERRTERVAAITLTAGIVNVGLNLLLVPRFGIAAAAVATLISFVLTFALGLWWSRDVRPVPLGGSTTWMITLVVLAGSGLVLATDAVTEAVAPRAAVRIAGAMALAAIGARMNIVRISDVVRDLVRRSRPAAS